MRSRRCRQPRRTRGCSGWPIRSIAGVGRLAVACFSEGIKRSAPEFRFWFADREISAIKEGNTYILHNACAKQFKVSFYNRK